MIRPNLYDILKVVALTTMVIDHIGYFFYPELLWLRRAGRFAFPIFLFLVWYNHSFKRRWSLRIWWVVIHGALWIWIELWLWTYGLYQWSIWINILLAIAMTRVLLNGAQRIPWWVTALCTLSILLLPYSYQTIEYGTMSVIWACIGYWVRTISARSVYSTRTYQIRCWGLLVLGGIGQWWITYVYFGRESVSLYTGVILISLMLWSMIYGNNTVNIPKRLKAWVLWFSTHALPLYAIHIVILYVLSLLL